MYDVLWTFDYSWYYDTKFACGPSCSVVAHTVLLPSGGVAALVTVCIFVFGVLESSGGRWYSELWVYTYMYMLIWLFS